MKELREEESNKKENKKSKTNKKIIYTRKKSETKSMGAEIWGRNGASIGQVKDSYYSARKGQNKVHTQAQTVE